MIRPYGGGVATTVSLVASPGGTTWWVVGATTPVISVSTPARDATISSPVTVSGRSTAYEGVVNVDLREEGTLTSFASARVMGGSMGAMGPFHSQLSFATPSTSFGAVIFEVRSPKDGSYIGATVIRVAFS